MSPAKLVFAPEWAPSACMFPFPCAVPRIYLFYVVPFLDLIEY
jgi:hypothetical protein